MNRKSRRRPPSSLHELRELLARLHAGTADIRPGQKSIQALAGLLDTPTNAALCSISDLAQRLGVNPSTLTRLAKTLGFSGFPALQALFRAELSNPSEPFSHRASRWLDDMPSGDPALDTLQQVSRDELNNLEVLRSHLDPQVMDAVAREMANARAIRVHGARLFYSLATFNAYCLGLIRDRVSLLDDTGTGLARGILDMEAGDLLFIMGVAPYTRSSIALAELAANRGMKVVALTDAYSSPLAGHADHVLITTTSGAFFANNIAAAVILSEALLLQIATRLGRRAVERLERHEQLVKELDIGLGS
ncbi:MAG: MurR/RpiR family transcriptional regulator [Gammaproteobacteria bacterium]|nr:MAG: MurR/RpiR family transcriptional regulator [Gammaproteobacteria bacterium]